MKDGTRSLGRGPASSSIPSKATQRRPVRAVSVIVRDDELGGGNVEIRLRVDERRTRRSLAVAMTMLHGSTILHR